MHAEQLMGMSMLGLEKAPELFVSQNHERTQVATRPARGQ